MSRKKQILFSYLCIVLLVMLSACGFEKKWIFSLNGENLYHKDIMAFGLIYAKEYNIENTEQLHEEYETGQTYEEYYMELLEDEILSTVLLYKAAKENKFTLSEEEKEQVKNDAAKLADSYGKDWMEKREFSTDDLENAYEMKYLGEKYIKSLSEEAGEEENQKDRYIKVYQVTFPTVAFDEDGMVLSNQDGTIQELPDSEKKEMKIQAEDYAQRVQAGEDMEKLLKEYDDSVTAIEKSLKYDDLDNAYQKAVDSLSKGETSNIIASDYGYYVIKLLETEDTDYKASVEGYEADKAVQDKKDEIIKKLYDTHIRDDKDYINTEKWEEITFISFLK